MINDKTKIEWNTKNMEELKRAFESMSTKLEARRETCRKSSKQYYNKTFKLNENATQEDIEKNKILLKKRNDYQKSYYEKNKEKIKLKQKEYRMRKKAEKKISV